MATGVMVSSYPGLEEHEAISADMRSKLQSLRSKNEEMRGQMKKLSMTCHMLTEKFFWTQKDIVDLEDRAKFVRIASISNPASIGQFAPKLKGPPPHEFYQQQVAKIRTVSRGLLEREAKRLGAPPSGGSSAPSSPARSSVSGSRSPKKAPSNFGEIESSVGEQPDSIFLGRRSPTHASANRWPGQLPPILTADGEEVVKENTASWMARLGRAEPTHHRDHIPPLTRTRSAPHDIGR